MKAAPVSRPTNSDGGCKDIPNCKEGDSIEHPQEPRQHELRPPFYITCYHNDTSLSRGNYLISSASTECSSSVGDNSMSSNLSLSSSLCDGFNSDTNSMTLCNEDGGESDQEQEGYQDDDEEERSHSATLSLSLHCHNSSSYDDDDSICRQSDSIDGESLSSDESIRDGFMCPAMIWTKLPDGNDHRKRDRDDKAGHHPEHHRHASTSSTSSRLITKRRRTKKRKLEILNRGDHRDREYIVWKRANRNTPIIF